MQQLPLRYKDNQNKILCRMVRYPLKLMLG